MFIGISLGLVGFQEALSSAPVASYMLWTTTDNMMWANGTDYMVWSN